MSRDPKAVVLGWDLTDPEQVQMKGAFHHEDVMRFEAIKRAFDKRYGLS